MKNYKEELENLNSLQREAVESIEGPVLVIAGPGTGKTQLLSMRVAYIMKNTDTDPTNILCLTFTNKAATNMKDRIISITGVEGRKVQVKTFHSFSAEIINQFPDYFWNGAKLSIAPDATQLEIIQNILNSLPLDNPLAIKFAGNFTSISAVQEGLKLAKEAGLTPEKLESIVKANLSYIDIIEPILVDLLTPTISKSYIPQIIVGVEQLPEDEPDPSVSTLLSLKVVLKESLEFAISQDEGTGKNTNVSKWKSKWIQSVAGQKSMANERKRNAWWLELSKVYKMYRTELHLRGYFDYSDMLVEVLYALENNPDLLAQVQEKFSYILIDEFQDTNAAQLNLAHTVANHEVANGRPNIMAVGDDDQAIFAFNGAELNNMLFFDRKYKDTKKIILSENYRSNQEILDVSAKVIDQAEDRLVTRDKTLTKNLKAVKEFKKGEILHYIYPTREYQMSDIARKIKKLKQIRARESTAVIARSHESLRSLASLLLHLKVPVSYEIKSNILESDPVKQSIIIAKTLIAIKKGDNENVSYLLSLLLRHPMWEIEPKILWDIALKNQYDPDWLSTMLKSENENLKTIADALLWLSSQTSHQPLGLNIEYILGLRKTPHYEMPIREYFSSKRQTNNDYLQMLSALQMLRELVSEFSINQSPTLEDFINFIEVNEKNNKAITDESPFVSDKDAVELYSVHKAKGLEFDNVFIIDAIEDNWKPKSNKRNPPANLALQTPLETEDDYARLLYVATTRARRNLYIASYANDSNKQEKLASTLIRHAINNAKNLEENELPDKITVLEEALNWPHLDESKEKELLKAKLANFSLNVSNLINFLDIENGGPEYFFERNILRLPEAKTPVLSYGTAIHAAMEEAQRQTNSEKFDLSSIKSAFEISLKAEHLPSSDYERLKIKGEQLIEKIFINFEYTLPKGSLREQSIKNIRLKNAQIGGKLDRIDFIKDKIVIVDYKTGRPLPSFETKNKALIKKAWSNKLQLIFYVLIAKNDPRFKSVKQIEGQMVYLDADSNKDLVKSYIPTEEDITKLENLIDAVWQKIINADWPDVSNYSKDFSGTTAFIDDLLKNKI